MNKLYQVTKVSLCMRVFGLDKHENHNGDYAMKRLICSLVAALFCGQMPITYAWIKLGELQHGEFMANQFYLACVAFILGLVVVYACPLWSENE